MPLSLKKRRSKTVQPVTNPVTHQAETMEQFPLTDEDGSSENEYDEFHIISARDVEIDKDYVYVVKASHAA
jgi:hypothetical protein